MSLAFIPSLGTAISAAKPEEGGLRIVNILDTMKSHLPIVFGFVLSLAFVLLLVTFRSIVAGIITSAAAVMVITFAMFATGGDQSLKQLGVGLASAIMIDAMVVRAVLLPATMKLLGSA